MITKTSRLAVKSLIYLALSDESQPISPRLIAEKIGASPSYTAKITRMLVKSNILQAHRGSKGGVILNKLPEAITLLAIIEACEGKIVGDYCIDLDTQMENVCSFHQAVLEAHQATTGVLSRWTLADLTARTGPSELIAKNVNCKMSTGVSNMEQK